MNIQSLIDKALEPSKEPRKRSGKFSPSSFGNCFRRQIWNRQDKPVSDPPDLEGLKRMAQGKATHKFIQQYLPKDIVEVLIEIEDIKGYADIVLLDSVEDIKCMDEWKFKKYWNIPSKEYIFKNTYSFYQPVWYALELKKAKAVLRGHIFGTFKCVRHEVYISDWKEKIEEELKTLRGWWKSGEIPPAEPRLYNGSECVYCNWRTVCKKTKEVK